MTQKQTQAYLSIVQSTHFYKSRICKYKVKDIELADNDSESTSDDAKLNDLPRSKLKVQLCRNFLYNKICPYKERCKFAHGLQELLRNTQLGQNFRTKKCKVYYQKKWCRFGQRCNFKHGDKEQGIKNFRKSLKILYNYPQIFLNKRKELDCSEEQIENYNYID